MAPIKPCLLDRFIVEHAPSTKLTLKSTAVDPLSLKDLQSFSDNPDGTGILDDGAIAYAPSCGSRKLRENVAAMYMEESGANVSWEDVIITSGAISANYLLLDTLLGPGDHVICQYPTYQQLYEVPRYAGADVSLWRSKVEDDWIPNVEELDRLVRQNTKMIIINNPCNPTGMAIPTSTLQSIVSFAEKRSIIIFSDEIFRPMWHTDIKPSSILTFGYKNVISTGSTSKGLALPGLRVGWMVSPNPSLLQPAVEVRDYTTISVGHIDDQIATFALFQPIRTKIIARTLDITQANMSLIESFVTEHQCASWIKPTAGACAFVLIKKDGVPVDDKVFCEDLLKKTGTLLIPAGYTFGTEAEDDFKGYLRLGLVHKPTDTVAVLEVLSKHLRDEGYKSVHGINGY